jgi:hypothetical protein
MPDHGLKEPPMPPSTNSHLPLSSHLTGRSAARAVMHLLSACADSIRRTLIASLRGDDDPDRRERPHLATLGALDALGWHVTEIRPSDAPVLWRVEIKRYDGAIAIVMIDATDPDAALEELARYAATDAEDPS